MVKNIIKAIDYTPLRGQHPTSPCLNVSELFTDTIQGEGVYAGHPATFLRLQGCSLDCIYCDTQEVWRYGDQYSFDRLLYLMDTYDVPAKLQAGQHLVLTGGSPLLQQQRLAEFLLAFIKQYNFKPFIEVENEAVIMPNSNMLYLVDCWNNSPKLENSGVPIDKRLKPRALGIVAGQENSWFKFVVSKEEDWNEIHSDFLRYINKSQIILMPKGETRAELEISRPITIELAVRKGVRYSDRLHVVAWDKKTGC